MYSHSALVHSPLVREYEQAPEVRQRKFLNVGLLFQ
jgi:hypothetical protein